MTTMRVAAMVIAGIAFGAAATALGLWLGAADRDESSASAVIGETTTTTVADHLAEPIWDEVGETRFESTIIIPAELSVLDDGTARLGYELRSLAQHDPFNFGVHYPAALPETWALITTSGTRVEAETDPPNRPQNLESGPPPVRDSVVFELPDGTRAADIDRVEVTGWRVAVPMSVEVTVPSTGGASFRTVDGTVVTLRTILEQRSGAIFDFDVEREPDPWRMTEDSQQFFSINGTFVPVGEGWTGSTGILGTGFQLTWSGENNPDEVRLQVRTTEWIPVSGTRLVHPVVVDG
jgi:hypothetical protein